MSWTTLLPYAFSILTAGIGTVVGHVLGVRQERHRHEHEKYLDRVKRLREVADRDAATLAVVMAPVAKIMHQTIQRAFREAEPGAERQTVIHGLISEVLDNVTKVNLMDDDELEDAYEKYIHATFALCEAEEINETSYQAYGKAHERLGIAAKAIVRRGRDPQPADPAGRLPSASRKELPPG